MDLRGVYMLPNLGTGNNNQMTEWLIYGAIALGVVIFFALVIYIVLTSRTKRQNKMQQQINDLDALRNALLASPIEAALAKVRSFEQTERISRRYHKWKAEWDEAQVALGGHMTDRIIELNDLVEKNKFKILPEKQNKVSIALDTEKTRLQNLEDEIKTFIQKEEYIQKQFEGVKDALKQVAQLFYANRTSLEPYTDKLQDNIEHLDRNLFKILDLMETEEKKETEEKLRELKEDILKEYNLIKKLPDAIALNTKVLQPQIKALDQAYTQMVESGFLFQGLNLDTRIDRLKDQVREVQDVTDSFNLATIENKGIHIRKQVEEIHQILLNEQAARDEVISMLELLNQKMNRLRFDKESFLDLWQNLNKRYEIPKAQTTHVDGFSSQVISAETKMILFNNQVEKNQEAYVVLVNELKTFDQQLNELDYSLNKLKKNVDTIKEDELYINAQYKQLKYMHHRSKRKVSQLPMELLPDDYLQKNDEAVTALQNIEASLENEVLDVKQLTELIETAQHLSIRFYKDTNMLLKAASFAEKAIIYSNRYRFDKNVQRHLAKAEYLYRQGEYTEALDISLLTLEAIEPGIYDTLLQAYEHAVSDEVNDGAGV